MPYNFTAHWQKGVLHNAPDALSRHTISDPTSVDKLAEHQQQHPCQIAALQQRQELNLKLQNVLEAAETNIKPFWHVCHDLTLDNDCIMFGCRLFIPDALRRRILCCLHESHQGISRTKKRARLAVYWPGIDRDIENVIAACKDCQHELPSLPKEPITSHIQPERPFQHLAGDFAQCYGQNYLVMTDCFSDWPSMQLMRQDNTARSLVPASSELFFTHSCCRYYMVRWRTPV